MLREPTRDDPSGHTQPVKSSRHVTARVWEGKPVELVPITDDKSEDFTEDVFEDALDRVSTPLKGRLAHVPYSSEDFIREKREEAELEDRPS